ncbi:MAG: hypothetical protein MSS69_04510 [Spirochaetales bacterium]|nr:hypothetical protein [Spirochaetales bacterium]
MKKLSKVLLFIAIVLCISLPLSAAKMMNVTWQWLLNDPYVTSYRYQLDGEADDGWTVVSADTDKYVATGLDPYKDYTLYLQCTYDGTIWSESAKSTAYALLEYVEVPTVEEEPVVEEPAPEPVVEEAPKTADFEVFGYTVNNSWVPGTLTSTSATKGLLSEADVRGFVLYEIEKYGDFLVENVAVEFIPDGFVITYPETEDAALYLPTYKADIEEYVAKLFAPVEEPVVEEIVVEEPVVEEIVEEVVPKTADFEVFGYTVNNSWIPGTLTSTSATKGLLSEADVRGFVLYEVEKYGDLLMLNAAVEFIPDGFVLTYPETEDVRAYLPTYKADIEEYVAMLFAPVEEPVVEEPAPEPVVEEATPETADFTVFGYTVNNSWIPGTLTSTSATKGLLSEADVRDFVLYEVEKYGDLLMLNTAVEFIPDGFVLTYPETEDAAAYLPTYKADIEEYIAKLFAPVEEPVVEEPVVEEVVPETADFEVFGYTVKNSWIPGTLTSTSATKGLLSEADVRGFVLYEVEKYGDLLMLNTAVEFIPDGFVLTYPETEDARAYLPTYKADIEEYVAKLFAPVEEPVVEEVVEVVVEPEVEVVEEPIVPEPVSDIIVTVVTDGVKVAQPEGMVSPAAEKVSKFDVSLSAGADFGFKTGRSYNPTIFPSFSVAGEFRNMFNLGPIGIGSRFDASFIFRPLDGTFIGHDFGFFLNGNNWAVDGTLDAKIMFSLDLEKTRAYLGFGIGYSLASNVSGITSHTGTQVFGFNSAVVATGVLGVQWKLGDTFFLSLEGQGRYFFQSKEYGVGAAVRMGWSF